MKDPYKILGVSRDASDKEIQKAYHALVKKYHPDNYSSDNPLKELATEKMQEINEAYDEIQRLRAGGGSSYSSSYSNDSSYSSSNFNEIRVLINQKRFNEAGKRLSAVGEWDRTAEWHYLMSVVLMQRGNVNDAMRELELACSMDPGNQEYQRAKTMFNNSARGYGSTYYDNGGAYGRRQRTSTDDACDCCANLICLDCLCECMGGDLIRCI